MGRVVHFEIPVDDADRAQAFYREVFGWDLAGWEGGGYWLATTGADSEAGINGALINRGDIHAAPVLVVGVASVDDALASAKAGGAEEVAAKDAIPGVGYAAYVRDPEGNVIGLFEDDPSAQG